MKFRELKTENSTLLDKMADSVISWIGSTASLVFHTLLFITSFLLPLFKVVDFEEMLFRSHNHCVFRSHLLVDFHSNVCATKVNKHIEVIRKM